MGRIPPLALHTMRVSFSERFFRGYKSCAPEADLYERFITLVFDAGLEDVPTFNANWGPGTLVRDTIVFVGNMYSFLTAV